MKERFSLEQLLSMADSLAVEKKRARKSKSVMVRLTEEQYNALQIVSRAHGKTVLDFIREAALAGVRIGQAKDEIQGLIEAHEERLVATMAAMLKEMRRLSRDSQIELAVLDTFIKSYFVHTPAVQPDAAELAQQEAARRYSLFLQAVPKALTNPEALPELAKEPIDD